MISSGHSSWLAQNLGIWFHNRGCHLPRFELASAECSILCLLLNMCSRCSAARCQTELLAVTWTGSPTASPKSLAKLASSRHPEHGQRLAGYVGNPYLIALRQRFSVPISTGGAKSAPSPPRPAAWRGSRRQGIDCVRYFAYAKFVIFEGHWIDSKRLQRLWSAVSLAGSDLRTG